MRYRPGGRGPERRECGSSCGDRRAVLQLHGNEPRHRGAAHPHAYSGASARADAARGQIPGEHLLVDARSPASWGTGHTCDWSLVRPLARKGAHVAEAHPRTSPRPSRASTVCVDVASGVGSTNRVQGQQAGRLSPRCQRLAIGPLPVSRALLVTVGERRPVTETSVPGYFGPRGPLAEPWCRRSKLALAMTTSAGDEYKASSVPLTTVGATPLTIAEHWPPFSIRTRALGSGAEAGTSATGRTRSTTRSVSGPCRRMGNGAS
jgi:hypothetical protein